MDTTNFTLQILELSPNQRAKTFAEFSDITAEYQIFLRASIAEGGAQLHVAAKDYLWASLPVAGFTQPFGALNGGASAYLAESVGSFLANLHAPDGKFAAGVDLTIHHHLPATSGRVYAVAKLISTSPKRAHIQFYIFRTDGELISSGSHTCVYLASSS